MSAQDILANMSRGWNRDPAGVATGTERTGVSAALWTHDREDVQEVWGEADPVRHIISIPIVTFPAEMFFDGKHAWSKPAAAQTFTIVHADRRPRAIHRGRWSVLHLYLPISLVDSLADAAAGRPAGSVELIDPACCSHDPAIERIGHEVLAEMREGRQLSQLRIDLLGQDLAIQLLRRHSNLASTRAFTRELSKGGLAPRHLQLVRDYLEDHLTEDVTLAELAALTGLSPHHLCRAFKQSTGLPPHRWRQALRIERAREMLERHGLSLSDIAAACGFASQQRFTTAFKNHVGATPAAWRRQRRS